jgi:non-ribosomal peptide synthase protein (TIGR01720 family)
MLFKGDGFAEGILRELFTGLVSHHDALRIVLPKDESNGIRQVNRPVAEPLYDLEVITIPDREGYEKEIENAAQLLQASIDLEKGPLLKVALFKTVNGHYLLIIAHHLVVDGISWRILLEDLETGYRVLEAGKPLEFPPKTSSFRDWALQLKEYSQSEAALRELEYWKALETIDVENLHLDYNPSARVTLESVENVSLTLDEPGTGALTTEVNRAYNTEINDILLTALSLALEEWKGLRRICIHLEGRGRESILKGLNPGRTVGWYTSMYPVLLDSSETQEIPGRIKAIKEMLRRIPNRGIGYGILRYLTPAEKKQGIQLGIQPSLRFNYLGEFGQEKGTADKMIRMSSLNKGDMLSPLTDQHYPLDINGMITAGTLIFNFSYNTLQFGRETIACLAGCFETALKRIINHCLSREEEELTVSDYSGTDLDENEVAAVFEELELE